MLAHHFDPVTGEFRAATPARLDPLETERSGEPVHLLPANATFDPPPEPADRTVAVWDGAGWSLVPDWRGVPLWDRATRQPVKLGLGAAPDFAVVTDIEPQAPLDAQKAAARVRLAVAAEAQRQRYITPGAGKALVYEAKLREAKAIAAVVAADGTPAAEDFPFAAARAELLDVSLAAVSAEWLARTAAWAAAGAAIEAAYEAGVLAIDAAGDEAAVAAALAAVAWPAG